jgi:hypothetical protein
MGMGHHGRQGVLGWLKRKKGFTRLVETEVWQSCVVQHGKREKEQQAACQAKDGINAVKVRVQNFRSLIKKHRLVFMHRTPPFGAFPCQSFLFSGD